MNKKGEMSVVGILGTIVIIGLIVVVFIWGFTTNWGFFRGTIGAYTGPNVDKILNACEQYCMTKERYSFCSVPRQVNFAEGVEIEEDGKKTNSIRRTCQQLADEFPQHGFSQCPQINC